MLNLIKNYINNPKFTDEPEERKAHFLAVINKAGALAALLICIAAIFADLRITLYATITLIPILILSLFLVYKQYILTASLITLIAILITMIFTSFAGDGIHDISMLLLPGIIIIASYLLNRKTFIIFTIISVGAIGLVRLLRDNAGITPLGNFNFATEYFTAICILTITAIGIRILLNNLMNAINRSHKSEKKYRHIFDNIQDVYFELDRSGHVIEISPAIVQLLSLTRDELLNQPFNQFFINKVNFDHFLAQIIQEKKLSNYEVDVKSKAGKRLIVSINALLIEGNPDEPEKIIGSIRDITDKKNLEDQLFQSQKLESIGKLAGGIAHDFNNLLTVISGHCEIALEKKTDYHQNLEAIQSASMKASGLTKQLLAFSRKQIYQPLNIDPNSIISDLKLMFQRLIGEDIEIKMDLNQTQKVRIKADPTQLEQIILNLLVNARDAIQQKSEKNYKKIITIHSDAATITDDFVAEHIDSYTGNFFILSISDTGIGIDENIQEHVFEPFFTTKPQGTGLGLSTVYGIVKQSDGFITINSEKNIGTTIKVYWPATEEILSKPDLKIDQAKLRGNEHILLVEDDSQVREFSKKLLENYGYTVYAAENGEIGLERYSEQKSSINLMITDVIMPKMNGIELAGAIRKINGKAKVLYISGYADDHLVQEDVSEKNINFLQKPFTSKEFLTKIRDILDNQ
jgi:two-component system, cell cycle sensor histidine kinase and response regulator CckA